MSHQHKNRATIAGTAKSLRHNELGRSRAVARALHYLSAGTGSPARQLGRPSVPPHATCEVTRASQRAPTRQACEPSLRQIVNGADVSGQVEASRDAATPNGIRGEERPMGRELLRRRERFAAQANGKGDSCTRRVRRRWRVHWWYEYARARQAPT